MFIRARVRARLRIRFRDRARFRVRAEDICKYTNNECLILMGAF